LALAGRRAAPTPNSEDRKDEPMTNTKETITRYVLTCESGLWACKQAWTTHIVCGVHKTPEAAMAEAKETMDDVEPWEAIEHDEQGNTTLWKATADDGEGVFLLNKEEIAL
jgi:hypothetical protein